MGKGMRHTQSWRPGAKGGIKGPRQAVREVGSRKQRPSAPPQQAQPPEAALPLCVPQGSDLIACTVQVWVTGPGGPVAPE